ncbi:MAG: single-stranded-DNA-specific exonuclease RecJ [Arcobacter sp.]|nr:MAG: single-stranded-DNA-specific exonuclease RecJ [Arcobacter sp.]
MSKITKSELFTLLEARHENDKYSRLANLPKPDRFKDIKKATLRIKKAITNNEQITIVGDYDVDGVVSTTIIVDFFKRIGVEVNYIIPNRFEHGYGLSPKIVDMIDDGLVITVDNGISAVDAALKLKEKNIDLIITDHHTVGEKIPDAFAIVNPKQEDCTFPFKEICGAQVAWYLCAAIKQEINATVELQEFFDLLSVAIIADIMPMTSLNYTMVKHGLKKIKTSKRPAFIKINEMMKKEFFVSDDVGFTIAPKINSAGRMDDASIALSFLLSENEYEANDGLQMLEELNCYRKTLQEEISQKANKATNKEDNGVIVWGEGWHEGVIGIVASKLSNAYKKPAFIFSIKDGIAKGSARANANINLHSIISETSDLLLGFGGHKNAAGLSLKVENLDEFKSRINILLNVEPEELHIEHDVLGELDISCVDLEFLDIIEKFEPYGLENHRPIFKVSNSKVLKSQLFGRDQNHLKLTLSNNGFVFEALRFNADRKILADYIDLVVAVNKNEFRGQINPQFLIQDIL